MDWGKVTYIFLSLMSLTTTAGFIYEPNTIALFIAASVNLISTIIKIGVKNLLAAELLASSLVADLHLIPAFLVVVFSGDIQLAIALAIGAVIANIVSIALSLIESAKSSEKEDY
ncbi:hypothetical protein CRU86_06755 [Aliarcobacter skirrowii]|jgi:hypothetical protein|uniref:Membrane protein n=2 Tax=Aliarcobacter skirrowii TaxID=28200 RepID=A0AAD0SKD2_9BACT|nr:DUF6394 family protein [Aliarcobacter skirrowii]AXX84218.1 putative membrane protein [Aliarcobacter skirrowii CCUG 10374]AZL53374.1 hypothetical protein EI285_01825 [Aliarcobacter skirrowii]KAB0621598.1 hypothetical protein F7P70_01795 [Aliarcobacter skirrowii CCUG 10374]MDD2507847.1 DUF6394 family protein [Aliarcobacter skirrowii]MDD3026138.1 DUF6394 family protein [Aliarcobacter skirrowii]